MKVDITKKEKYIVTNDYNALEETEDYSAFRNVIDSRYRFEILYGTYAKDGHNNLAFRTLRIYSYTGKQINSLISNNWRYELITMDLFNLYPFTQSYHLLVEKYFNNKYDSSKQLILRKNDIVELLQEFDLLQDSEDVNSIVESLKQQNIELKAENQGLKSLIKDLKRRINNSIKGLRK